MYFLQNNFLFSDQFIKVPTSSACSKFFVVLKTVVPPGEYEVDVSMPIRAEVHVGEGSVS